MFRYWVRSMHGKEQNLTGYKDDDAMEGRDKDVRRFLVSVYLNAAACLLKKNTRNSPGETVWTCTEVIDMDDACVKAYYRRAMAYIQMDSSATLELAVNDLASVARALRQETEMFAQHCRSTVPRTRRKTPRTRRRTVACSPRATVCTPRMSAKRCVSPGRL